MSRTTGLVAGTGVLAAGGAVVVRSVAGSVVVVVAALKERVVRRTIGETAADTHAAAAIAVSEPGLSLSVTAAERHGDGVTLGVAATHRLAPAALSHVELLLESGGEIHSPRSGASQAWWLQAKRRPLRMQRLIYIYQYWNPLSSNFTKIAVKCIISSWT